MIRIFLPLLCAALGFAAASCNQSESPFAPAEAPSSPQSKSHGSAAAAMPSSPHSPQEQTQAQDAAQPAPDPDQAASSAAQPSATPQGFAAETEPDAPTTAPVERRASTLIGVPVASTDGSPLGDVKDIIFDRQGRATHLVIAYRSQPDAAAQDAPGDPKAASSADAKLTAMPWDAAVASMKGGRLVLDSSKLQGAPNFTPDAWPNLDDPAWSSAADTYWRKAVQAAIAAHPGAPIDSTDRQRGRSRTGDGTGP
jgi:sporulation protein YlmC with PRC-barrel domain